MDAKNFRIGWIVPQIRPYNRVMASTRIRCYDVIKYLQEHNIFSEIYRPFKKYQLVIFQKAFSEKFIKKAKKLKKKGTKVILDVNVNFVDPDEAQVTAQHIVNIKQMLEISDAIIVSSPYLKDLYSRFHPNIYLIEEIIESRFFEYKKEQRANRLKLVFCGYAIKARELLLIKDILKHFMEVYNIELIIISEKEPRLKDLSFVFYKYNHKILPQLLLKGDVKIAPRDLTKRYNLGHSFTRIGYPMALGLCVVASPVPSYSGAPILTSSNEQQWRDNLKKILSSLDLRKELSEKGRKYVRNNFSKEAIIPKYISFFNNILK